jgi:hypothetical protein
MFDAAASRSSARAAALPVSTGLVAPAPAARADLIHPARGGPTTMGAIIKVVPCAIFYCGISLSLKESHGPGVRP